jgi:hypothetical protein
VEKDKAKILAQYESGRHAVWPEYNTAFVLRTPQKKMDTVPEHILK